MSPSAKYGRYFNAPKIELLQDNTFKKSMHTSRQNNVLMPFGGGEGGRKESVSFKNYTSYINILSG
jgi:hypothetical protein